MTPLRELMRIFWRYLREACGENDYQRHLDRTRALGLEPMTAEAFFVARLQRRYSRPNRCC